MPMFLASKPNGPLIQYKHYRIDVSQVGKGWRASIYASNATHPLADSPVSLEIKSGIGAAFCSCGQRVINVGWVKNRWLADSVPLMNLGPGSDRVAAIAWLQTSENSLLPKVNEQYGP